MAEFSFLEKLAEQGLLALLLAGAIWLYIRAKQENKDLWERLLKTSNESKAALDLQAETNRALAKTQDERTAAQLVQAKANEMTAQQVTALTEEMRRYRNRADEGHGKLDALIAKIDAMVNNRRQA